MVFFNFLNKQRVHVPCICLVFGSSPYACIGHCREPPLLDHIMDLVLKDIASYPSFLFSISLSSKQLVPVYDWAPSFVHWLHDIYDREAWDDLSYWGVQTEDVITIIRDDQLLLRRTETLFRLGRTFTLGAASGAFVLTHFALPLRDKPCSVSWQISCSWVQKISPMLAHLRQTPAERWLGSDQVRSERLRAFPPMAAAAATGPAPMYIAVLRGTETVQEAPVSTTDYVRAQLATNAHEAANWDRAGMLTGTRKPMRLELVVLVGPRPVALVGPRPVAGEVLHGLILWT